MKKTLDTYESGIERSAAAYRPASPRKRLKIETIVRSARKTRIINIRISGSVLAELKKRSQEEGIPYQALISSVLFKYVTDRLVDEKALRSSIALLSVRRRKTIARV